MASDIVIKSNSNQIEKPEWKWYYFIPFTRGRKDYIKDRNRYEDQFLTNIEKIRKKQETSINSVSILLILGITTTWSLLPPLVSNMPNWLEWTKMGMDGFGGHNWGNQIFLTIVPGVSGTLIHKAPNWLPNKNLKIGANIVIKIIPVILLVLCYYLIGTERKIWAIKKQNKAINLYQPESLKVV